MVILRRFSKLMYSLQSGASASRTTELVSGLTHKVNGSVAASESYTYDNFGNIKTITEDGVLQASYEYTSMNMLKRENNAAQGKTYYYTYDYAGNIQTVSEYAYTTADTLGTPLRTVNYGYRSSGWKDVLTTWDGQTLTYDAIGNPLSYRDGMHFTWQNVIL